MKNLALTDYLDLSNKEERRQSIIKLLLGFVVLAFAYTIGPVIITKLFVHALARTVLLLFIVLVALIANYLCKTTKVVKQQLQGQSRFLNTIFYLYLIFFMILPEIPAKQKILELPLNKLLAILILAINAGVIEEFLFRGILFNACLEYFSSTRYMFVWTSISTSLVFGMLHLINAVHQPLLSTVGQMIFAFGLGMIFSYLRLITNGISAGILLHVWQDTSITITTNNWGNSNIIVVLAIAIVEALLVLLCVYFYNKKYNRQFKNTKYDTKSTEFDVNVQE